MHPLSTGNVASVIEELNLPLINLNLNGHTQLMATILDSAGLEK